LLTLTLSAPKGGEGSAPASPPLLAGDGM
jgi:hypothetical protein